MNNNSAIRQHSFKYNFTVASKSILRTLVLLGICFIIKIPAMDFTLEEDVFETK